MTTTSHLLKTNDFAKLCHVNKKTLIYYDQIDLFKPYYTDANDYRYYSYHQYDTFSMISALKEIGMPLKKIKAFLDDKSPDALVRTLTAQKEALDAHIQKLQHTSQILDTVIKTTQDAQLIDSSSITVLEEDEVYLTLSNPILDHDAKSFFPLLSDHIQYCFEHKLEEGYPIGALLSQDYLLNHQFTSINYLFTKTSTHHQSPSSFIKPKGLYAIAFHVGNYDTTPTTYERLLTFIKEHHLEICGNSYEETLLDSLSYANPSQYLTRIAIQVRSTK